MLPINQHLQQGRYRITQQFGQDAVGAAYEAYDNVLETNVLLKETPVSLGRVTTASQMETLKLDFADKVKSLTEIKHESLLHVHDYVSEIDRHYLVMELVDGNNLSELIEKKQSPFALSDVTNWADQLLDALNYLHTHKPPILHRDIKPQNVKLTSNGKVKLIAPGISKSADAKEDTGAMNQDFDSANLHYLPLEQIWSGLDAASQKVITSRYDEKSVSVLMQPLDARSDIYALGATLYHLVTARLPIDALERSIDILEGKADPLPTPNQINGAVPGEVSKVIMKALEIKREDRFSSATIMRQVLRTALAMVKEREAKEAKNRAAAPEISVSSQKSQLGEQDILEIDVEQNQQMELIKRQLQEAEAQRLLAEQRAAEVEKQLREKEAAKSVEKESIAAEVNSAEDFTENFVEEPFLADISPESIEENFAVDDAPIELGGLFAEPEKSGKSFRAMAAVAVVVVMLSGAALGIWFLQSSKAVESNQTISSDTTKPAPTVETAPAPSSETTSETSAASTETSANPTVAQSPAVTDTSASAPTVKNKPVVQQTATPVKKQTPAAAKTPEPKKAVTLDDLIKEN